MTTAITLFAIFRFTAEILAVTWIGAWSLLQGLFLIARISDSGAGSNISRVMAMRVKEGSRLDLRNFAAASLVIASAPSIIFSLLTAPIVGLYVVHQFGFELGREELWTLVWLALLNSSVSALATVTLAVCEGVFQLNYKSMAIIVSNFVGVISLVPLLRAAGPAGIGWTYVVISGTQLLLAAIRVIRIAAPEARFSLPSIKSHVRELWRENLHLSGIALIRLSFEPVTKFLLSLFAPLLIIAQFELALRVTTQIRIVVQSALQPLVALGARSVRETHPDIHDIFDRNDRLLCIISIGLLMAQILAAPAIQTVGMGSNSTIFLVFFAILAAGNAVNTMGIAGYYWQLTSGALIPLVRVQAVMACANILVGSLGRLFESATLIVTAYSAAFLVGGLASRSFLPQSSFRKILAWTLIALTSAMASAVLVLFVGPTSSVAVAALLGCSGVFAVVCLMIVYHVSRRGIK
ncbi:O-antigen/teichoic acid export membrane protein [Mycolicibacterium iranicum]|uniref:O-antigen/teichoic acid export membrane protein n=1 Tax=Mycolicibacterium iranicum TaxID=912594 RepID=A0A839QFU4_MYCIR|nr:hypothetical protein [Mycolicibacterium iranicum]MBB2991281.1 O-antigen/teichoic acid export membrane protein [Mycolicibacterium iranicum]